MNRTKSYYRGKPEVVEPKQKKKVKEEDSLIDWALQTGDYKFADELMQRDKVKSWELEAVNNKLDRLQNSIDRFGSFETRKEITEHVVKKHKEQEEEY
tara:strand:+ start:256 stop:549 length:294 start_codon:yes stop_codon:yes gene_type:complete